MTGVRQAWERRRESQAGAHQRGPEMSAVYAGSGEDCTKQILIKGGKGVIHAHHKATWRLCSRVGFKQGSL